MTKELPILFSTPMVQALLAGKKTQTRRIIKPQPIDNREVDGNFFEGNHKGYVKVDGHPNWQEQFASEFCGYEPGDILYVRENWKLVGWNFEDGEAVFEYSDGTKGEHYLPDEDDYKSYEWLSNKVWNLEADGIYKPKKKRVKDDDDVQLIRTDKPQPFKPSIHLPKWASRIWLKVKSVRVERLHDISEADAIAEGVQIIDSTKGKPIYTDYFGRFHQGGGYTTPGNSFLSLWMSINGEENCLSNPWVWVVEFEVLSTTGKPK
jgi:hypothetical protein